MHWLAIGAAVPKTRQSGIIGPIMPRRLSCLVVAALLAVPLAAVGANLGKVTVLSKTGEPLNVEIDIVAIRADERDSLAGSLASPEALRAASVTLQPRAEVMRAKVDRDPNGRYVLRLTSTEPVGQPLVDVLLELSWTGGRILRLYSFLLAPGDATPLPVPPTLAESPAPVAPEPLAPRAERDGSGAGAQAERAQPVAPERPAPRAERDGRGAGSQRDAQYRVAPGDTLAKIALGVRREGRTLDQAMVAIFNANRGTFVDDNLNRLRAGSLLAIPSADEVAAIPAEQARRVVAEHRVAFEDYRRRLAGAVAAGPPAATQAERREPGRVAARGEPSAPKGDRLALQGDPADDIASRELAIAASRERIRKLEETIAGLRQLLEGRDREIERLERRFPPAPPDRN